MKKRFGLILALALVAALLTSCGGAKGGYDSAVSEEYYNSAAETPMASPTEMGEVASDAAGAAYDSGEGGLRGAEQYGLKIVYNAYLDIETLDYDKSCADIVAAVKAVGGYLSYTETGGGYTYGSSAGGYNNRRAYYTARIPADNYDEFLQKGDSFGNVVNSSNSSSDITSQYIDTEARLNSLKEQETRLLELLSQSGSLEDLLAIEDRLSEVRYQIESYTSTMKAYDDMVSFCTVDINLREVNTITVDTTNFGSELVEALKGSGRAVINFLRGLVIALIYALPFVVIIGAVVYLVLRLTKKTRAERKAKRLAVKQAAASGAFTSETSAENSSEEK